MSILNIWTQKKNSTQQIACDICETDFVRITIHIFRFELKDK